MANDIEPFSVLSPFPHHVCLVLPNISTVFLFQKSLDKTGINLYNRFTMLKRAIQQGGDDYEDHISAQGRLPLPQPVPAGGEASNSWEIWQPSEEPFAEQ